MAVLFSLVFFVWSKDSLSGCNTFYFYTSQVGMTDFDAENSGRMVITTALSVYPSGNRSI